MKRIMMSLIAAVALAQAWAAEPVWMTDLAKAKEVAKAGNKMVLIDFTGSDWCGFCIKFNKEVASTPEFAEYAKKNLVLVELDYPRKKELSADQKAANDKWKKEYNVRGFPTFVVLDSSGKEVGREVGYGGGGPKAFLKKLDGYKK